MITAIDAKTALVLIDLQKGIVSLPLAHPAAQVVANSAALVRAFRSKGLPVIVVNVNPVGAPWTQVRAEQSNSPKGEEAINEARQMMQDTGFFEIIPQIEAGSGDLFITKTTWNAFYNTPLNDALQRLGVTGIVLAGIATSVGVESTARAASERGYNLTFAHDAMTDMHLPAHENSLKYIFPRIGEVDTTEAIIAMLTATNA